MSAPDQPGLVRSLTLAQATSINMIDMVGIGPFITVSFIAGALQGPLCLLAWLLGAFLAYMDGMVWAELGAKWPEAGGSYVFLGKLFGRGTLGRLAAFLFICQTMVQAPLVMASAAIGFPQYLRYLVPLSDWQAQVVSGSLIVLVVAVLYRKIGTIGKISVVLWWITGCTLLFVIGSGFLHFKPSLLLHEWRMPPVLFVALGQASLHAIYSYLGYYNVTHLGAEISRPEKNIPRSILLSISGIALLYLGMQLSLLGNLPWREIAQSQFAVSTFMERVYNARVAAVVTGFILIIAMSSLFSATLGYSRIPYAAARNGDFFAVFGRLHRKYHFPHVSLLALGAIAFVISVLCNLEKVIMAIVTMRILVQFIGQSVGLLLWHVRKPREPRPYTMPLFPLPALISICIWLYVLCCSQWYFVLGAVGIIALGTGLFFLKEAYSPGRPTGAGV